MAQIVGTLGAVESLTIGGRTFIDVSNLIILHAVILTAGNGTTFRKSNGSAGYTPSGSKTYVVNALRLAPSNVASTAGLYTLAQSNNDIGLDSGTALGGPVYIAGGLNAGGFAPPQTLGQVPVDFALAFTIANTRFLTLADPGSAGKVMAIAYGYEV